MNLHSSFRFHVAPGLVAVASAFLIAGCGSGGSSTITVGNENTADNALISSTEKGSTTSSPSTPATASAKTPTSGPLSKKPVITVPKGPAPKKLVIKDLIKGTGAVVKASQEVTVNYVGVLYKNGKEFDSSWKRGEPTSFPLSGVIAGWTKGIPGMRIGGRRELIIPAKEAYGAKGTPGIPPNSPLVFVIDLLAVKA
jgi:peptidylprolyl isomerase